MAKITNEARTELIALVVGMFDGAPGREVLADLIAAHEAGSSLLDLAEVLTTSGEYKQLYGNTTAEEFIEKMVESLVGDLVSDEAKQEAIDLFLPELNAGATEAQVFVSAITALLNTGEEDETWSAARIALENKIDVANYHSVTQNQPTTTLDELRAVLDGVDDTDASVEAAKAAVDGGSNPGEVHNLTVGPDAITGGFGNDVFNALPVDGNGVAATTLSGFDAIDGGAGRDTLNIYTDGTINGTLPATATVKNIEVVNVYNAGAAGAFGDVSKFEGIEELWQHGSAVAVTNLSEDVTAGFRNVESVVGTGVDVTTAAGATSANIALDGFKGDNVTNVAELAVDSAGTATTNKLSTINVTGTIAQNTVNTTAASLALDATLAASADTATVNTAVKTTLDLTGAGIRTVDLSGSTGGVTYAAGATNIHTIKGGSGADVLTIDTATSGAISALVDAGAGNNTVNLKATGTGTAKVVTGAGKDTVVVDTGNGVKIDVSTGEGDDTIELANGVIISSSTRIDGGDGNDTLSVQGGSALIAQDYILIENGVTNVETLAFRTGGTDVDASRMEQFDTLSFTGAGNVADKASGVALRVAGDLEAYSTGYATTPTKAYGGDLAITQISGGTIDAHGNNVVLNVATTAPLSAANVASTVTGDAKALTVNLLTTTNPVTQATSEASVSLTTGMGENDALTSLVLNGNGDATVMNSGKLATVDASGLGGKSTATATAGDVIGGLDYTANDALAETITLGSGADTVTTNSTLEVMDIIVGFDAVKETNDNKSVTDVLVFNGTTLDGSAEDQAVGITLSEFATSLEVALTEAAQQAGTDTVFFHFGGNTYLFDDTAGADAGEVDDGDAVIEIAGLIDFSAEWATFVAA